MRIEGTYLFPAPVERVFDALLDPVLLKQIIPGVERLIQLGPPAADGVSFTAWIHADERLATVGWHVLPTRRPAHLRLTLRGHFPVTGAFAARGTIDLVAHERHTRGAYTLDLDLLPGADVSVAGVRTALAALCERLAAALYDEAPMPTQEPPPAGGPRTVATRRGRIVAISAVSASRFSIAPWAERAMWMGAGLALGIAAISLALAFAHRLNSHDT